VNFCTPEFDPATLPLSGGEAKRVQLDTLRNKYANCRRCSLCETRTNLIFGSGNPDAVVMIISANPNWYEDQEGYPMAGGQAPYFTDALSSIGLTVGDTYCASYTKCLPQRVDPHDRNSERKISDETAERCRVMILRQIEIVRPAGIVCHGKAASKLLLGDLRPLGKYAGHFRAFGTKCFAMSTYSPGLVSFKPDEYKCIYMQHWEQFAYRLHGLGRLYRPDADLFRRGWTWDLGLPPDKNATVEIPQEESDYDEPPF